MGARMIKQDNSKITSEKESVSSDWIYLAQGIGQRWTPLNTALNLRGYTKWEGFLNWLSAY
jgi:hypothetical protein